MTWCRGCPRVDERPPLADPGLRAQVRGIPVVIPTDPDWPVSMGEDARTLLAAYGSCTQAIVLAFEEDLGFADQRLFQAAGAFHAGMTVCGTCGIFTAGILILGALMGRPEPTLGRAALHPIVGPGQRMYGALRNTLGSDSCAALSGLTPALVAGSEADRTQPPNGGCGDLVAQGATIIAESLQALPAPTPLRAP